MKKVRTNNEGFSLVELIIVIAIMAILSAALAPQLIKYIDKSRKSTDVNTGQSIATAVGVALTDEAAYNAALVGITSTNTSNTFWISECDGTHAGANSFKLKVAEILGGAPPKPKYKASGTDAYNDFAIVITKNGSTISYAIYPAYKAGDSDLYTVKAEDMVYPTVGTNYAN